MIATFLLASLVVSVVLAGAEPATANFSEVALQHDFSVGRDAEGVATFTASCERCDWSRVGREGVALNVQLDGKYWQTVLVVQAGETTHEILLGPLRAGKHTLIVARDATHSAKEVGTVRVGSPAMRFVDGTSADFGWLAAAPIVYARPGTIEGFSDVPLAMYVEALPSRRGYRYTVIFSHEDGGTPTDRLMATWGRSTDIEFVYEVERMSDGTVRQEYQGPKHEVLAFRGGHTGAHPLLWVSTDNNMVSDSGPTELRRFAFAPHLIDLTNMSREVFMDANPWLYAVMTAELIREGRIDPNGAAGSGKIPSPLLFGYVEACGELRDATLAFDIAVNAGGQTTWHSSDRGDARFRIARSGCFRAAVPLPTGTQPAHIRDLRVRAYPRPPRQGEAPLAPGTGTAILTRVNTIFMLNERFTPVPRGKRWAGMLDVRTDGSAVTVP